MKLIIAFLLLLTLKSSFGQHRDLILQGKIDSLVKSQMAGNEIVGISIGIVRNNTIFYMKGYGLATKDTNLPVDSITNFHAASISKLFTATGIMQLVEVGKMDIDKKLTYYLPEFSMKDERYRGITIKQMLNHTSGLPDISDYSWDHPKTNRGALKNYVLKTKFDSLLFAPGTDFSYSNLAFDILGHIIEKITRQEFEDYINEKILKPTGMSRSSFDLNKINSGRRSSPHIKDSASKSVMVSKIYPFNKEHGPCGTLNTNAYDLSKWMMENLTIYNDSTNSYHGVIKHATHRTMWTPTYPHKFPGLYLGLAWWKRELKEFDNYFFHVGLDVGYSCTLNIFPKQGVGIVILSNGDYPHDIIYRKMPFDIVRLLIGK